MTRIAKFLSELPEHVLAAFLFTFLTIALGIVGEMDYQEALRIEEERKSFHTMEVAP